MAPLTVVCPEADTSALAFPFAHALYLPVSLLSGITELAEMPRIWLAQGGFLLLLIVISRTVFRFAVRKVTVQGG